MTDIIEKSKAMTAMLRLKDRPGYADCVDDMRIEIERLQAENAALKSAHDAIDRLYRDAGRTNIERLDKINKLSDALKELLAVEWVGMEGKMYPTCPFCGNYEPQPAPDPSHIAYLMAVDPNSYQYDLEWWQRYVPEMGHTPDCPRQKAAALVNESEVKE